MLMHLGVYKNPIIIYVQVKDLLRSIEFRVLRSPCKYHSSKSKAWNDIHILPVGATVILEPGDL